MNTQPSETNDTPRVDAARKSIVHTYEYHKTFDKLTDFARTLERELNEANALVVSEGDEIRALKSKVDYLRLDVQEKRNKIDEANEKIERLEKELSELRRDKASLVSLVHDLSKAYGDLLSSELETTTSNPAHSDELLSRYSEIIEAMSQKG